MIQKKNKKSKNAFLSDSQTPDIVQATVALSEETFPTRIRLVSLRCQISTVPSYQTVPIRQASGHVCEAFSWLLINIGGPSQL